MRRTMRARVIGAAGLCLLAAPLLRLWRAPTATPPPVPVARFVPPQPHSPFGVAMREAWSWHVRAQLAVNRERETLEAWDPQGIERLRPEAWRRELMACDPHGDLRRALAAARRAAALAHTPRETYRAALLLALIECDLGHHEAELAQVRTCVRLAPHHPWSLDVLCRAARCNGLEALARKAQAARAALVAAPPPVRKAEE